MKKIEESAFLFGLPIFSSRREDLLKKLGERLKTITTAQTPPLVIMTPNPEQVVISRENPNFQANLLQADMLLPDGVGLVWAGRLLAKKTHSTGPVERIAGVEVVAELWQQLKDQDLVCLIVGGRDYVSAGGSEFRTDQPGRSQLDKNTYWLPGYTQVGSPRASEEAVVVQTLRELHPGVVFVAFGAPAQEAWIVQHKELLAAAKVRIVMTVGGSFDFLLGKVARAPEWMRALGLEWLYRLIQEPWRWRRQTRLGKFIWLTLSEFFSPQGWT